MAVLPFADPLPWGQLSPLRIEGDDVFVGLGRGLEAVVSLTDLPRVEGIRWLPMVTNKGHAYAYRRTADNPLILMHRYLLEAPNGTPVDHKDGDGLNNRRENIRFCTLSQNMGNMYEMRTNKLKLKGVYEQTRRDGSRKYKACIHKNDVTIHLGHYATAEEASAAYAGAAKVLFGEFAKS